VPTVDIPSTEPTGRYRPMSALGEAADVADVRAPAEDDVEYLYVEEFDATYEWDGTSTATIDNVRVLGVEDEQGRWLLIGHEVSLRPFGGVARDWERLMLAVTAMAYFGKVNASGEAWRDDSLERYPSGGYLEFMSGATLAADLEPVGLDGSFAASPFWNDGGTGVADLTTLAADADVGDIEIVVTSAAGLAEEDWILIDKPGGDAGVAWLCQRQIRAINGTTLTLDTPLCRPYTTGGGVSVINGTHDVRIIGNGLRVSGTGDAIVQFNAMNNCRIQGIYGEGTYGIYLFCADVGSRDSVFEDCQGDGLDATNVVFQADYSERIRHVDCRSKRGKISNLAHNSSDFCAVVRGNHTEHTQVGGNRAVWKVDILDTADTIGCQGIRGDGVAIAHGVGPGLLVQNGGEVTLVDPDISACQSGIVVTGGVSASKVTAFGGRIHANASASVIAQQNSVGVSYGTVIDAPPTTATGGTWTEH
jgi:hypothetical protein